jgi:TRAP tripartite ATP-independent transporter, binding protein
VAAPGVPGGGVMTAIGLLESMLGFNESMIALMIALYLAQDSFGTATNVTGDATIATFTERFSKLMGINPDSEIRDEDIEKAESISA